MNLNDFFETNSTALEAIELFEDYCEEKSTKKAVLNEIKSGIADGLFVNCVKDATRWYTGLYTGSTFNYGTNS